MKLRPSLVSSLSYPDLPTRFPKSPPLLVQVRPPPSYVEASSQGAAPSRQLPCVDRRTRLQRLRFLRIAPLQPSSPSASAAAGGLAPSHLEGDGSDAGLRRIQWRPFDGGPRRGSSSWRLRRYSGGGRLWRRARPRRRPWVKLLVGSPAPRAAPPEQLKLQPSALNGPSRRLLPIPSRHLLLQVPIPSRHLLLQVLIPSCWLLPKIFLHGCITNEQGLCYVALDANSVMCGV